MFNILSKYENHKVIFEHFLKSNDFKKALFECQSSYPTYNLSNTDTAKATKKMFTFFEDWFFNLDDSITDIEYIAFLDSYSNNFKNSIRDMFLQIDLSTSVEENNSNTSSEVIVDIKNESQFTFINNLNH